MRRDTTNRDYADPGYNPVAGWTPYPDSEAGWRELYDFRWQTYLLYPYSAGVQKQEHLFRAFDDSGNEIDQTRRIFRYYAFISDTDARALHGGRLTLETMDMKPGASKSAQLAKGEEVWKRSRLDAMFPKWARMLCPLGDWWVEAVRMSPTPPYNTKLVGYDPRTVTATYDAQTGTELEEVRILLDYQDAEEARMGMPSPTVHRYERILTRTNVKILEDGVVTSDKPHGLGVVPIVHLQALPWDQPEHSLPAPAGVERALMILDGALTQAKAIGNRYAQPTLITHGFKLGRSSEVQKFGRMIDGAPADGRAEYLESKLASMPHLLEQMREIHNHIRDTSPEFLFASDAAQESAEARSMRGQAFEAKMAEMRAGVFAALAEVTAMAVAMDEARAFDLGTVPYRIDAPPVLPRNVKAEVEVLDLVRGDMLRADRIRALQRLGIVSNEHDPETYVSEVMDETADRATQFFVDAPTADNPKPATDAPADDVPDIGKQGSGGTPPVDIALNGAQVTSANEILDKLAAGLITPADAAYRLEQFFGFTPEVAAAMVAKAAQAKPPPALV